jgi:hypothetical protein
LKIKCNQFYLTEVFSKGSVYEKFIIKNKEYFVIAIRFTSEKGGEVLIATEYLYTLKWLPMEGLEITDNFIPRSWQYGEFSSEIGRGICCCSNEFDINVLNNGYTALNEDLYPIVAKELKYLKEITIINDEQKPRNLENKMTIHMKEYNLKKFTPDIYEKIIPSRLQIYKLANEIEDYIKKYQMSERWLYFTNEIKKCCLLDINEMDLVSMVLKYITVPESLCDIHVSNEKITEKEYYKINNELDILSQKLIYCCDYLLAKHKYLYLFDD